jgi:hypothetical protein
MGQVVSILLANNPRIKMERAKPGDQQCEHVNCNGQCNLKAVDGGNRCRAHGGNKQENSIKAKELRNYRLARFNARIGEMGNSDYLLNLKDEVGVMRYILEEKLNACQNTQDLILQSGPLTDMIMKIDRVVTSCSKLEMKLGNFLDRTKITSMAQVIVQIITRHVTDETVIEAISDEILEALENI